MKTYFCTLILSLAALMFTCCENDTNDPWKNRIETFTTKDGKTIKIRTDTTCYFSTDKFPLFESDFANPDETETLKRFTDNRNEEYWIKASFGEWCKKKGLNPNKTYLIREEYYYQTISDNPGHIAVPYITENSQMGFIKSRGALTIGYNGGPTTAPYEGVRGNCETLIIHIGYDTEGYSVDKYFPCDPYELEWTYSWYDLKNLTNK